MRQATLQDISRRVEKIKCRSDKQQRTFLFKVLCTLSKQAEVTVDELIRMEDDTNIRQKMLDQLRDETLLIRSAINGSYMYHGHAIEVCVQEFYKDQCQSCDRDNRSFWKRFVFSQ